MRAGLVGRQESEGGRTHPCQNRQTKQNTTRERQTGDHREHKGKFMSYGMAERSRYN